ncbi:MAG: hypothetical protein K8T10_02320 [Candidatus Eremiobacteraeota bacterium]|nr:hypothetical protein [Candidatus Eremiobacteraeota bacterium]
MDKIGAPNQTMGSISSQSILSDGYNGVKDGVQTALDEFIPGRKYSSVEINTNLPEYQNVSQDDAAKMLGYFTQKMEAQGFPWALHTPKKGFLGKMKQIGEFEALKRLEKGDPIVFQPKRVIGLGFNPPQLKGKDITGQEAKGKFDMKSGGMEVKFGVPVEIKNKGELKFLYQLYNPDVEIEEAEGNEMRTAARELAFFTKGTMASQYPWKMYKNEGKLSKAWKIAKGTAKKGLIGAGIGAAVTSIFTIPAIAIGSIGGPVGLAAGIAVGAAIGIFSGLKANSKGTEINAFESLARLAEEKPVYFQEKKKREIGISIPFPVGIQLGSLSTYSNHGEGSTISDLKELKLFHKIQEQK